MGPNEGRMGLVSTANFLPSRVAIYAYAPVRAWTALWCIEPEVNNKQKETSDVNQSGWLASGTTCPHHSPYAFVQ